MDEDQTFGLLYTVLLLVLVGSAVFSRAIPMRQIFRMILGWVGIFALVILLLSFRAEMQAVAKRILSELGLSNLVIEPPQIIGSTYQIRKSPDGHFWVNAKVAGNDHRFLIDSGATMTGISMTTATAMGAEISNMQIPVTIETANGTIAAKRGTIAEMQIGPLRVKDHKIIAAQNLGEINVLGMNFLSALKSWRVDGDVMTLEPMDSDDR